MRGVLIRTAIVAMALAPASSSPGAPRDATYEVIKRQATPGVKLSLDVRLDRKVPPEMLESMARKLRSAESGKYQRVFILYYLPGMSPGAGAWASSHFNPDLEVEILGLSAKEEAALAKAESSKGHDVVGVWMDDSPFTGGRISIYEKSGQLYLERKFKDGSSSTNEMSSTKTSRGMRFQTTEENMAGEYYLIDARGDLQIWDSDGLISKVRRLEN